MLLSPPALQAPAPDADVRRLGERLFEAMRTRDLVALQALFLPDARLLTTFTREGKPLLRVLTVAEFARMVQETKEPYDERMPAVEVRLDGNVATIWGAYDFRVGLRLTNCGINAVQCVRTAEGWRIAQILSTLRTQGCGTADSK